MNARSADTLNPWIGFLKGKHTELMKSANENQNLKV